MFVLSGGILVQPPRAQAHRLDECLHAARIAVGEGRVDIDLDLTPGIAIAAKMLERIDLDHDGHISSVEGEAYADLVRHALKFNVDDQPSILRIEWNEFPTAEEIKEGLGVIRLKMCANLPKFEGGTHRVFFRHGDLPEQNVYLANALQPLSKRIEITRQERDGTQREFRLQFRVR